VQLKKKKSLYSRPETARTLASQLRIGANELHLTHFLARLIVKKHCHEGRMFIKTQSRVRIHAAQQEICVIHNRTRPRRRRYRSKSTILMIFSFFWPQYISAWDSLRSTHAIKWFRKSIKQKCL